MQFLSIDKSDSKGRLERVIHTYYSREDEVRRWTSIINIKIKSNGI